MPSHKNIQFSQLHKAVFASGALVDRPLTPEGAGDTYWASDTEELFLANSDATAWVEIDINDIGVPVLSLDDLTDVDISSPLNNQVLRYNSVSGNWEAQTLSIALELDDLTDVNTVGRAKGSLITTYFNDIIVDFPVGTNGYLLSANSANNFGLEWIEPLFGDNLLTDSDGNILVDSDGNVLFEQP